MLFRSDPPPLLPPADLQLPPVLPAALRTGPLPAPPCAQVRLAHPRSPCLLTTEPCSGSPARRFDAETGLLHPSTASFKEHAPTRLAVLVLRVLAALRLVRLTEDPRTGAITETTNLTILNVFLLRFGPRREDGLVKVLIASQVRLPTPFRPSVFAGVGSCDSRSLGASLRSSCGTGWRGWCMMVTGGSDWYAWSLSW